MYSRVYVEITNICNMHCSFCHGHSRKPAKMDGRTFCHILDQLQGQTEYIYYHLMGEPLTHPDLPLFLQMAARKGFRSVITTNGTLLEQRGDAILAAGLHKVNISLHSFEGDDNQAFTRYLRHAADFAKKASAAGVLVAFRLWNKGCDNGRNDQVLAYLRTQLQDPWVENSRGFRVKDKVYLEWGDRFQWPDKEAPVQSDRVFCYGLRDHFGILCDGSVVPCCLDSDGVITLGNILHQEIAEILSSDRTVAMVKGFQNRMASEELCRRCAYAQRFV